MVSVYPIVLTPAKKGGYTVYVPDFNINTQGSDMADAIYMARDAISLMGIDMEEDGKLLPKPSILDHIEIKTGETKTLVDVDFEAYRKRSDNRSVRKNLTIPSWLNVEAEKAGINFSATLQAALKDQLGL